MKNILLLIALLLSNASYSNVNIGEPIQASFLNSILERVGLLEMKAGARAYAGSGQAQSISRASSQNIIFSLESYDNKNNMSNNGTYTVGLGDSGIYNINSVVWFSNNTYRGICYLSISVNGIRVSDGAVYHNSSDRLNCSVNDSLKLNEGDIVNIQMYQAHENSAHDNDPLSYRHFTIVKN
jgi:aconitase B